MKKIIVLLLILSLTIFAITGCNGAIPPTEGEGEGEGEGKTEQVVLVEAYVSDGCANCKVVEPYLEQLAKEYGRDKMILVQIVPWLSYVTTNGGDRYKWYSLSGGTPQILVNGLAYTPLTGTSSYLAIKNRIASQLNGTPRISIEATRTENNGTSVINGKIKNISSGDLLNLVVNCMTFRNNGVFPYYVTKVFDDEKVSIPSLTAGETKNFSMTLEGVNWNAMKMNGVVFVQETTGKKIVRQSLFIK